MLRQVIETVVAVVTNIIKEGMVYIDVVRLDTFTFDITFTATDNDKTNKMSSKPLVVTVSSADVLEQDYQVVQQNVAGNFEFSQVDVGFRADASHELVFEDGFLFAENHAAAVGTTDTNSLEPAVGTALGDSKYSVATTGPIKSVVLLSGGP